MTSHFSSLIHNGHLGAGCPCLLIIYIASFHVLYLSRFLSRWGTVLSFLFFVHRLIFLSLDSLVVRLGILIHQPFSFTLRLTRCSSRILTAPIGPGNVKESCTNPIYFNPGCAEFAEAIWWDSLNSSQLVRCMINTVRRDFQNSISLLETRLPYLDDISSKGSWDHVPVKIPGEPGGRTPAKTHFHNDFIFVIKSPQAWLGRNVLDRGLVSSLLREGRRVEDALRSQPPRTIPEVWHALISHCL